MASSAAQRRRLRAILRHEQSIAMALAAALHHRREPCSNEVGGRCVGVCATVPLRQCPRGRRGGESSEPATFVRGETLQKTRGPRVCPPAKAESVRLQRAICLV